jgi:hypothetical protein
VEFINFVSNQRNLGFSGVDVTEPPWSPTNHKLVNWCDDGRDVVNNVVGLDGKHISGMGFFFMKKH